MEALSHASDECLPVEPRGDHRRVERFDAVQRIETDRERKEQRHREEIIERLDSVTVEQNVGLADHPLEREHGGDQHLGDHHGDELITKSIGVRRSYSDALTTLAHVSVGQPGEREHHQRLQKAIDANIQDTVELCVTISACERATIGKDGSVDREERTDDQHGGHEKWHDTKLVEPMETRRQWTGARVPIDDTQQKPIDRQLR